MSLYNIHEFVELKKSIRYVGNEWTKPAKAITSPKSDLVRPNQKPTQCKVSTIKAIRAANSKISNTTLSQKVSVLDWYHANDSCQTKTALHFSNI
jgi:hypothetical protein